MPYRRLPNTDSSRLRALESALNKGDTTLPFNLAFSQSTFQKIKYFLPTFKEAIEMNKIAYSRYNQKSEVYDNMQRKAKMYISHFIQVANFAIQRGDLPPQTRTFYELEENEKKTPSLNTEREILEWGDKIIKGEAVRVSKGLTPITNPTIAVVKVHYEKFLRANKTQKVLYEASQTAQKKLNKKRKEAHELTVKLWNEVEEYLSKYPPNEKREKASEYGLVYVYRKHETPVFENAN
ncbi:MAG: hypothetical protein GXO79_03770 [Chlorobi bacterium]|nr:hypothetical protein [Chlorobiota bacterium]